MEAEDSWSHPMCNMRLNLRPFSTGCHVKKNHPVLSPALKKKMCCSTEHSFVVSAASTQPFSCLQEAFWVGSSLLGWSLGSWLMPQAANVIVKGFQGHPRTHGETQITTKIHKTHPAHPYYEYRMFCDSMWQCCPSPAMSSLLQKTPSDCARIGPARKYTRVLSLSLSLPPSPYTRARTWGLPRLRSPLKSFIRFHFEVGAWLSLYHSTVLPVLSESPTSRSSRTCFGPCVDRKWRRGSDRPTTCGSTLQSPTKGWFSIATTRVHPLHLI